MKKLISIIYVLFLLLLVSQLCASEFLINSYQFAASCTDCSGATKFAWHMENADVTEGDPCGCSDGDEIGEVVGSPTLSTTQTSDGTYSLYVDALDEHYKWDISGNDIVNPLDFKVVFDVYISSYPSTDWHSIDIWGVWGDSNDYCRLTLEDRGATNQITGYCVLNGSSENVHVVVGTGAWKTSCEWQFKDGVAGNDNYLTCDGNTDEDDDDPTTFDTTPTYMYLGDVRGSSTSGGAYYVDVVSVSASDRY